MKHLINSLSLLLLFSLFLTSCDKNDDDNNLVTVYLNSTQIPYNSSDVWTQVLSNTDKIISQNVVFSHSANSEWSSWNGFVVSRNQDFADYSAQGFWPNHQYTAMPCGGKSGLGTPYLVAYWNSSEAKDVKLTNASCAITYGTEGQLFTPQQILITNTSYTYYTVSKGSAFSKKFVAGDYLRLLVYGVRQDDTKTEPVAVYLADYTDSKTLLLKDWEYVNLEALGEVKGIYFQMESSDSGQYGINTPTYFAADRLSIKLKQ